MGWRLALCAGCEPALQHLALYSLRGCRKRDYPPSFNYNSTWWKHNQVVEDYYARLGAVLSQGVAVRDVLVIHPTATGWSMLGAGDSSLNEVDLLGERLNAFTQAILATHYDLDLGDEQIMSRHGRVDGDRIHVAEAEYRVVVIPPGTTTLLHSTIELLERFISAGGRVLVVGMPPTMVAAETSERLTVLWSAPSVSMLGDTSELESALESCLERKVSLRNAHGRQDDSLLYMQRDIDGVQAYFVVNSDRERTSAVQIELAGTGRLEEWDALTGETSVVPCRQVRGRTAFATEIAATGSKLFVLDPRHEPAIATEESRVAFSPTLGAARQASYLGPAFAFSRTDPNVLTLDTCSFRMGDGAWSEAMDVWLAQMPNPRAARDAPELLQWAASTLQMGRAPTRERRLAGLSMFLL